MHKPSEEEELPPPASTPRARRPPRPTKRLIETAASGIARKRAKPAQVVYTLPASNSWVSCDNCNKWRRIAQEPTAEKWYCSDNQDAKHNACSVPQELANAVIDGELELAQEAAMQVAGRTDVGLPARRHAQQCLCEHGRRRYECKECGGASICQHGRQRSKCKECGGASICQHGQERSQCKECGGASICQHGQRRSQCKECGGASICQHGRVRSRCKECKGENPPVCEPLTDEEEELHPIDFMNAD